MIRSEAVSWIWNQITEAALLDMLAGRITPEQYDEIFACTVEAMKVVGVTQREMDEVRVRH